MQKPTGCFQKQFVTVINQSGETYTNIAYMWGAETDKKIRSLQTQLTRWIRQLPKTIDTLVLLLNCLGYRLHIEPHNGKGDVIGAYQTRFIQVIEDTGLSRADIGAKYAQATKTNPDAMRVTLGRWLRETPRAIIELIVLLDCLDCRLVIERN